MNQSYLCGVALALVLASEMGWAQSADCQVKHQPFVDGGVAQGRMRVLNNGKACGFTVKFGGSFDPTSWKVDEAPKHGRLEVGGSSVKYFPEPGYAGPDAFTVAVFGTNPFRGSVHGNIDGRFAIKVEVRAAP